MADIDWNAIRRDPPLVYTAPGGASPETPVRSNPQLLVYVRNTIVKHSGSYYRVIVDATSKDPTDTTDWESLSNPTVNPFVGEGNYPIAVGIFQDRLIFASTRDHPNTIWGSAIGVYNQFIGGSRDADPYVYTLASDKSDSIQWIDSKDLMIVGTDGSEWIIDGAGKAITPTNIRVDRQTKFGSFFVAGRLINENVIFVQRGGRKIREYAYSNDAQAYHAADLTRMADHITKSGVVAMEYQSDPDQIMWFVRADGELIGLTYEKDSNVLAWHRHITDGVIESVAVIPNDGEDEIWVTVRREIGGVTKRYIEYFESREIDVQRDLFNVDCGITLDGSAPKVITGATAADPVVITSATHGLTSGDHVRVLSIDKMIELEGRAFRVTVIDADSFSLDNEDGSGRDGTSTEGTFEKVFYQVTGLDHLEGEEVDIVNDGGAHQRRTVTGGTVELVDGLYANTIHVGLPYKSRIRTMRIEARIPQAIRSRVVSARVKFLDTVGGRLGPDEENLSDIVPRSATDLLGLPPALFTGEKSAPLKASYESQSYLEIIQDLPLPMTVLAVLPELDANGG